MRAFPLCLCASALDVLFYFLASWRERSPVSMG